MIGKIVKIVLMAMLIAIVIIAMVADNPLVTAMVDILNFTFYARIVSILGLIIAVFFAAGYKHRIEISKKYRLANQILSEAQAAAKRKERAMMLLDEKLKAEYTRKVRVLHDQMGEQEVEHRRQMMALETQNVRLKEAVNKLMHIVKTKKEQGSKLS